MQKETLIADYETKLEESKDELELRMKVEIHEIEERKNHYRDDLMENHTKSFKETKVSSTMRFSL